MKLFSTHGYLSKQCRKKPRTHKNRGKAVTKSFCYPEPMDIHFFYRLHIYDHKYYRHQPIGLDSVRETKFWDDRVFTLLFSVTDTNT